MAEKSNDLVRCPCCNKGFVDEGHEFDICPVCGWEDDDYQFSHPDYSGGANHMSLNEARQAYREGRQVK